MSNYRPPQRYNVTSGDHVICTSPANRSLVLMCTLVKAVYEKHAPDEDGEMRWEWMYQLQPVNPHNHPHVDTSKPVWVWESDIRPVWAWQPGVFVKT